MATTKTKDAAPTLRGTPALYKYQSVKYSHFSVPPGASYVLTSNPWSFLQAWLRQRIPKKKGKHKTQFTRALYYARIAEDFYRTANVAGMPIKGTLSYYGMLNLVKCFISVRGVELEEKLEHHGLTLPLGQSMTVKITNAGSGMSIFAEFAKQLGKPIKGEALLPLSDIFVHLPEIHEMAHSLGKLPWKRRKFLPVEIDFCVNDNKDRLFTEIRYEKKNDSRVDITKFYEAKRKAYFKNRGEEKGWVIYRSAKRKKICKDNIHIIYRNIQKEYFGFNLCSILTRTGYKYYCDLKPGDYHHLSYSLALLFYIGSIARYRPTEAEKLLSGEYSPLASEAVSVLPQQFLYQLVSFVTDNVCVVPQAKLE